jgi:hypothetical protein
MEKILDKIVGRLKDGDDLGVQVFLSSGVFFQGPIRWGKDDDVLGLYIMDTMTANAKGDLEGTAKVYFKGEDVQAVILKEFPKVTVPEGAGKIIVTRS